ncbi:MAG: 23S rRNA (adenine(2503)-C(2))-methyltransferase RlmN [Gemmatimonadaceae bacterium]
MAPSESLACLEQFISERGEASYRAAQIARRLWHLPAPSFAEMTEIPTALRQALAEAFDIPRLQIAAREQSVDGTQKFLFRLHDGQSIEAVAIPDGRRLTLCVSSQAGCALRCAFCATGAMGFSRNLTADEIAGQVRELRLLDEPLVASNVVFMGMGEPLLNWAAVDTALTILNDPEGCGIGARHITVSTVGVLPGIVALAERREQFRLAISIHAPSDSLRKELMPINTKYPLADVIEAAKAFDRRVTFEYVMLHGVNDQQEHAAALAQLARDCRAFVNLIPLHPGGSLGFESTPRGQIATFARAVRQRGVEVAIRQSRGLDIAAACGQLRVNRLGRRAPRRSEDHGRIDEA